MSLISSVASSWQTNEEGWPLSPEGYTFSKDSEVGKGAFAKVLQARCESKDNKRVAIKVMALENITTSMEEIQMEVHAMKMNKHPNVLDLYCCFVVGSELWLVMPLMDKGSCYYAMRCLRKGNIISEGQGFAEDVITLILHELLHGLVYIHSNQQIHRDIKAGNILINSDGRIAIADFGVAGWTHSSAGAGGATGASEGGRRTFVGTPCWMAPEVMEQQGTYNEKADIWSVGITALELAKGSAPYANYPPMTILIKTIREPPPTLRSYSDGHAVRLSDAFSKFVARCLHKNSALRCESAGQSCRLSSESVERRNVLTAASPCPLPFPLRPSAAELLLDPLFSRGVKAVKFDSILAGVPSVGATGAGSVASSSMMSSGDCSVGDAMADGARVGGASDDASGSRPHGEPERPLVAPGTTWVFPDDAASALADGRVPLSAFHEADNERDDGEDEDAAEQSIDDVRVFNIDSSMRIDDVCVAHLFSPPTPRTPPPP
jgi:serine/threonine-protein kinase OSR1/STK39